MYRHPARLRQLAASVSLTVVSAPFFWAAAPAHAGGFALIEHGASGLGNAYAGAAAVSADTSTVWFNPAGMSEIDSREMAVGLHILDASTDWTDNGTVLGYAVGATPVSGPDTASPGATNTLPNFYYVAPINDRWSYGLSIGVPFGSSSEYDPNWKGRYTTIESSLSVLDINPAVSYRLSDSIRLGFGVSFQQLTVELESAVDSGVVCLNFAANPGTSFGSQDCLAAGLTPGNFATDSNADLTGDSTAFGFNLGVLYLPVENVKLGVAYRHSIKHDVEGDADFTTNATLRAILDGNTVAQSQPLTQGFLQDRGLASEVELPSTLSFSGAWQMNDAIELLSDFTWTNWSVFEELRVSFDNPAIQPDSVSVQNWNDAFRFSLGVNYRYSPRLLFRAGYAFDEEPIVGAELRTARIPGNDRTWLSLGLGYQFSDKLSLDVGYAHLMLDETAIDNPNLEQEGAGTYVRGVFDTSVNILSAQLNWDF